MSRCKHDIETEQCSLCLGDNARICEWCGTLLLPEQDRFCSKQCVGMNLRQVRNSQIEMIDRVRQEYRRQLTGTDYWPSEDDA